jgi:hypothetical protein
MAAYIQNTDMGKPNVLDTNAYRIGRQNEFQEKGPPNNNSFLSSVIKCLQIISPTSKAKLKESPIPMKKTVIPVPRSRFMEGGNGREAPFLNAVIDSFQKICKIIYVSS